MTDDCGLCRGVYETSRVVHETETTYSMIPLHPLRQGHVLVLPKRHVIQAQLTAKEAHELNLHSAELVDIINRRYAATPPLTASLGNTTHATIPYHFHIHILPSAGNLRDLVSHYRPELPEVIPRMEEAELRELERMAILLRY